MCLIDDGDRVLQNVLESPSSADYPSSSRTSEGIISHKHKNYFVYKYADIKTEKNKYWEVLRFKWLQQVWF